MAEQTIRLPTPSDPALSSAGQNHECTAGLCGQPHWTEVRGASDSWPEHRLSRVVSHDSSHLHPVSGHRPRSRPLQIRRGSKVLQEVVGYFLRSGPGRRQVKCKVVDGFYDDCNDTSVAGVFDIISWPFFSLSHKKICNWKSWVIRNWTSHLGFFYICLSCLLTLSVIYWMRFWSKCCRSDWVSH